MQVINRREFLLERRQQNPVVESLWGQLSLAQKFAASSLVQLGYDLHFIRNSNTDNVAVFLCDGLTATISSEGEVDTDPDINTRSI
jgi:hypothetical protein